MNHKLAKRDRSIATCTQTQMLTNRATRAPSHVSDGICELLCVPSAMVRAKEIILDKELRFS